MIERGAKFSMTAHDLVILLGHHQPYAVAIPIRAHASLRPNDFGATKRFVLNAEVVQGK
jgi:hypothetical protein